MDYGQVLRGWSDAGTAAIMGMDVRYYFQRTDTAMMEKGEKKMDLIDLDEVLRQNCVDRMDGKSCEECKYHVLEVSCERLMEQPTIDAVEVIRCGKCRYYQGNHKAPGCAPCAFWGIGGVMWDDFCKRGERWDG